MLLAAAGDLPDITNPFPGRAPVSRLLIGRGSERRRKERFQRGALVPTASYGTWVKARSRTPPGPRSLTQDVAGAAEDL